MAFWKRAIELFDQYEKDARFNTDRHPYEDAHRRHAYAVIDAQLEAKIITPKKVAQLKRDWDRRHGY